MAMQHYVPGPCPVMVGTGTAGAYEQLGWTQSGVRLSIEGKFQDVEADFAGMTAADSQYMGEEATISFELSKFVEAVFKKLAARCASAAAVTGGSVPGTVPPAAAAAGIGTLMVQEGAAVSLCLPSIYAASKTGMSTMIPSWTFGAAWAINNLDLELSSRVKYPRVIMRAVPIWNSGTGAGVLYTNILPTLPSLA